MALYGMTDEDLEQMYQEVILDAARDPHGKTDLGVSETESDGSTTLAVAHEYCVPAQSHQFNPTCGDEVTVHVEVSDGTDGNPPRIQRLVWDGQGCSISQASLSVMVDLIEHKTVDEAMKVAQDFHTLMDSRGKGMPEDFDDEALGDAVVFQGVSRYPMRIKCALLGWEGMKASVAQALSALENKPAAVLQTKGR
ncbi:Fe-S cluster assembly sulfur transfer protein SufU [Bifidobacterium sp.]|jgi:nitrogen fixation NifU-like protein|uniref:Fe-S cluster assembly sulfur transfer protein SufU n=1 Tax=Bifidobacterium sp. TaxID=41200 RepID=UPI0025B7FC8B|nr:SUF system NifU family Fe-S cluster assembly protein [Bifidobacterium sp.]MCI1635829.1 SUF system NifU family Fe-S cluster assembly protein [Bifidobacterium sp.]